MKGIEESNLGKRSHITVQAPKNPVNLSAAEIAHQCPTQDRNGLAFILRCELPQEGCELRPGNSVAKANPEGADS